MRYEDVERQLLSFCNTATERLDDFEKRLNRPSFGEPNDACDHYKNALSTLVRSSDDS